MDGDPRIETYVGDLLELLDAQGIAQADFVGISFGGRVLQALALQAPHRVRRLVLVATSAAPLSSKRSNVLAKIGTMSAEQIFDDIVPLLFSPAYIAANEKRLRAFANGRARNPLDPRGIAMQWEALSHFDVRTELDTLDHPVLVVHGTADALCPIQAAHNLVDYLPNAELVCMDGVGHSPQVEDWHAFNQTLDNFLRLPQV